MNRIVSILSVFLIFSLASCVEEIEPKLNDAGNYLLVDAFVNNKPERQEIFVNRTVPYFDQTKLRHQSGATVWLDEYDGKSTSPLATYNFVEGDSSYYFDTNDSLGSVGNFYILNLVVNGKTYQAASSMGRVPPIDSIKFSYEPANAFIDTEFYLAEFVARDFVGSGDTYWIKTFKNGWFLNQTNEINIAFDAGFSSGGNVDGRVFIQPIQNAVNPFDTDENDAFLPPYKVGDSIYVEINSISLPTFYFMQELIIQTNRPTGFGALFASPLANVTTNITPIDADNQLPVFGFFNMAAVSGQGLLFTEELATEAKRIYEEENK